VVRVGELCSVINLPRSLMRDLCRPTLSQRTPFRHGAVEEAVLVRRVDIGGDPSIYELVVCSLNNSGLCVLPPELFTLVCQAVPDSGPANLAHLCLAYRRTWHVGHAHLT
jgi:hypothetical protein